MPEAKRAKPITAAQQRKKRGELNELGREAFYMGTLKTPKVAGQPAASGDDSSE